VVLAQARGTPTGAAAWSLERLLVVVAVKLGMDSRELLISRAAESPNESR
jgi:hypothetical protein